ncbi:MAG: DUF1858 domain-containing protein [Eubacteriales bacterium]|jgi:hypothetical protein|nr:DUF1858 domain-containing protein [Eubacteriales bacterium]
MSIKRTINLHRSVHDLCTEYPELIEFMKEAGFPDIVKPGMLATAGRFMTLPKGAMMKGIELGQLVEKLRALGFEVES